MKNTGVVIVAIATVLSGCNQTKSATGIEAEQEAAVTTGKTSVVYSRLEHVCRMTEQDVIDANNVVYNQYKIYFKGSPFYDYFYHGQSLAAASSLDDLERVIISQGNGTLTAGCNALISEVRNLSIKFGR